MNNVKIKLDSAGVRELLKSQGIAGKCQEIAQRVASAAGDGYEASLRKYPERTGAAIHPDGAKAYYDNLRNNTLAKAIKGAQG
jgi:hypothetical protein